MKKHTVLSPRVILFVAITSSLLSSARATPLIEAPTYRLMHEALAPGLAPLKEKNAVISPLDKYRTALSLLAAGSQELGVSLGTPVNKTTISDLNILFYDTSKPLDTILKKISRTQTTLGECALGALLITPLVDKEALLSRQNIIRELVENDTLRESLVEMIAPFAEKEEQLLALWNRNDAIYGKSMADLFYGGNIYKAHSAAHFGLKRKGLDAFELASPLIGFGAARLIKKISFNPTKNKTQKATQAPPAAPIAMPEIDAAAPPQADPAEAPPVVPAKESAFSKIAAPAFDAATYGFTALGFFISWKTFFSKLKNRQVLLKELKMRFKSLVRLAETIKRVSTFADTTAVKLPALQTIREFNSPKNADIQLFFKKLSGNAFQLRKGYMSFKIGTVLAALPQFLTLRHRLTSVLHAVAELDALLSIATLVKEHQNYKNNYCFAAYEDGRHGPHLKASDYWHPIMNPATAIPNSIELGGTQAKRNMIITGPNAGGKSVSTKGMMLITLFAQTLTVVPGREITLTPFTLLNTYLNIVEDAGKGMSQHRAEVRRALELIQQISSLPDNEYALTVMDEMFRCTSPTAGAAAAYGIGKEMGKRKNSLLVLATHYFHLTKLADEAESSFANFHVAATKNTDGSFTYPYKLFPGINATVIALDLLAKEGFNKQVLEYADEHLKRVQEQERSPSRKHKQASHVPVGSQDNFRH